MKQIILLLALFFSLDSFGAYVGSKDWVIEVNKGNIPKHSMVHKFGSNTVGTSPTMLCSGGDYKTPTTVTALEVVSDSANDTNTSGSGCHQVTITGIGAGWTVLSETINMNGTTAVATANSYFRVYSAKCVASGTYATSAGPSHSSTITLRVASAGATWAIIEPLGGLGLATTEIGAYTIPTGYTGYVMGYELFVDSTKTVTSMFFQRENADDITTPFSGVMKVTSLIRTITDNSIILDPYGSISGPIVGPADIGFMAFVGTGSADVEVSFNLLLVQD